MPAQLIALNDGMRILLDKPILLLGREPECDIQFDSRKVSRRHCCIAQVGDRLIVRDLGSTNGIRINGVRVLEGYLNTGDELTIGNQRYQVSWGEQSQSVRRPPAGGPPAKVLPRPVPIQDVEDDVLEAADEPVPIFEGPNPGIRAAPPKPPIIPEHLELASSGDSFSSHVPPAPQ
jgi:pSer/pThr/pTyr-binding forkhead associated (FHA) protein